MAEEGINVTVAGSVLATELYMSAVMNHPFFSHLTREQFKVSIPTLPDVFYLPVCSVLYRCGNIGRKADREGGNKLVAGSRHIFSKSVDSSQ